MNVAIVGAQWGDEGKGKVVDLYSARADLVARFQGGNNAGHTMVVNGQTTIVHLIPSGILHPERRCLIGNGMVFDPDVFFKEVEELQSMGALGENPEQRLEVSERAHVILPYHLLLDRLREEKAGKGKIGTTVRGIGPAYEDKINRWGVQVIDLLYPRLLKEKMEKSLSEKNVLFKHYFDHEPVDLNEVYEKALAWGEKLKPFMADVRQSLLEAQNQGKKILFEGAQGTLLDIDHGTYPYVTSSNTTSGAALTGCGVSSSSLDNVIGISKAYTTRVGTGPFPSELEQRDPEMADTLRKNGAEFGATTGRSRRTGWLDLVALRYAAQVNGFTGLALMKIDVLTGLKEVKLATAYRLRGETRTSFPNCLEDMEELEPVYETLEGWESYDPAQAQAFSDLPANLQKYVRRIEEFVGVPVVLLSTGPGREETLELVPGIF